jgi:hypothetical protein
MHHAVLIPKHNGATVVSDSSTQHDAGMCAGQTEAAAIAATQHAAVVSQLICRVGKLSRWVKQHISVYRTMAFTAKAIQLQCLLSAS